MILDTKKQGVYMFTCIPTNKVYIGSTTQSFHKRFVQHARELRNDKHKNKYFQFAYNKYGKENFKFTILEIVEDLSLIFEKEQYWMDYYNCYDKEKGYNINPLATGGTQFAQEVYDKRRVTFTKTTQTAGEYFRSMKNGEITIDEVPEKYKKLALHKFTHIPWNKGLTSEVVDYSYLKVKKTITPKLIESNKQQSIQRRLESKNILVYDASGKYLKIFNSIPDLEDWSKINNDLPLILANPNGRNGLDPKILKAQNIFRCVNNHIPHYKGLIFRYEGSNIPIIPLTLDMFPRTTSKEQLSRLLEQSNNDNSVNSEKL